MYYYTIPFFSVSALRLLFGTPGNAALIEVIDRYLNGHLIARQYFDIIHTQLARNVRRYDMTVRKLNFEGRVRQRLNHDALKLNYIILRQNNHPTL